MDTFRLQFLEHNNLPGSYLAFAREWIEPLGDNLVRQFKALRKQQSNRGMIVGISGCQGSGKSTMAEYVKLYLCNQHGLTAANCSFDDFYLSKNKRQMLAKEHHPLLATRGVPGTHEIDELLECLEHAKNRRAFKLPHFNKLKDDRSQEFQTIEAGIDILIVEGWCLGAEPQDHGGLEKPVNALEEFEDADGVWRRFVNDKLQNQYRKLTHYFDSIIMLKAPSFSVVQAWRLEQERKLAAKQSLAAMEQNDIRRFIQFFQRITEQLLKTLPARADYVLELDEQRNIVSQQVPKRKQDLA